MHPRHLLCILLLTKQYIAQAKKHSKIPVARNCLFFGDYRGDSWYVHIKKVRDITHLSPTHCLHEFGSKPNHPPRKIREHELDLVRVALGTQPRLPKATKFDGTTAHGWCGGGSENNVDQSPNGGDLSAA